MQGFTDSQIPVSGFPVLVIGIGNHYRSDDAVGPVVAQMLKTMNLPGVTVIEESGESVALMEAWKDTDRVIVVDAAFSGGAPGTIYRFDARVQQIPRSLFAHYSTHALSIADAIELARTLNQLPPCLIVYGIESKYFEPGIGLSPEVEQAAHDVVHRVAQEIQTKLQKLNAERR